MTIKQALMLSAAAVVVAALFVGAPSQPNAQTPAVAIDNDDIGGVVTGPKGPEAGVWVIAETTDLPTKYAKIVVTDDQGRYVLPDLPKAKYKVWVRGYGLVDSRQGRCRARPRAQPDRGGGAERRKRRPSTIRRSTGTRCCGFRRRANSPAPVRRATASIPVSARKRIGWPTSNRSAASHVTRSARRARAPSRRNSAATSPIRATPGCAACRPGRRWDRWSASITRLGPDRAVAEWADWTDRVAAGETAEGEADAAAGRRAQRGAHAVGLGRSEDLSARPDRDRPAQADGQCQRQDLRHAGAQLGPGAGARSGDAHRVQRSSIRCSTRRRRRPASSMR